MMGFGSESLVPQNLQPRFQPFLFSCRSSISLPLLFLGKGSASVGDVEPFKSTLGHFHPSSIHRPRHDRRRTPQIADGRLGQSRRLSETACRRARTKGQRGPVRGGKHTRRRRWRRVRRIPVALPFAVVVVRSGRGC